MEAASNCSRTGQSRRLLATAIMAEILFRMVRFLRLLAMEITAGTSFRMVRFLRLLAMAITAEISGSCSLLLKKQRYSGFPVVVNEVGVWR
jgi:hypothetical protein